MDMWHWTLAFCLTASIAMCVYLQIRLTKAEERQRANQQAGEALKTLHNDVQDKFQALADAALRRSQQQFLDLAGETFSKHKEGISGDLRELLKPVEKTFGEFGHKVDKIRQISAEERQTMQKQLEHTSELLLRASQETTKLSNALSAPKGGGRWGEETLRNVMEMAGMSEYCDFNKQVHIRTTDGPGMRPDVVVRMPGGRTLVIDSKVSLDKYLAAANQSDPDILERHLADHARAVRSHYKTLASKGYWKQFENAPDFVAMFIPGENFYSEALRRDRNLFDDAAKDSVVIVTPATLVALAKAVAFGWRQEKIAQNTRDVAKLGRDLHERLKTMLGHMNKSTQALKRCVDSHNDMIGSLESRVLPAARKFEELGVSDQTNSLPDIKRIDTQPRIPNT